MMEDYLTFAKRVAINAGKVIREHYGAVFIEKEKQEAVTEIDRAVNRYLIEEVEKAFPDHSIYGEEETLIKDSKFTWVCDPIDGTLHFTTRTPISCFSLALCEDGEPKLGVIYDVFSDRLYTGVKGEGSFLNGERLRVNDKKLAANTIVDQEWWPFAGFDIEQPLHALSLKTKAYFVKLGSAVYVCTLVARGQYAALVFPGAANKCMDIAAAKVIIEEAGGKVTDFAGNDQRYDTGTINGAIVSNGVVHQDLVDAVKDAPRI